MGIETKTITVNKVICDGLHCKKELKTNKDGIVLMGVIQNIEGKTLLGELDIRKPNAFVYCWDCLIGALPDLPVRTVEKIKTVEKIVEVPKIVEKPVYYQRDDSSSGAYDYSIGRNRSGGASGPLPPPELPHYVKITKNLTKVK